MSSLVLIVDDHENVRKALRHVLEDAGYRTCEASNGEEALLVAGKTRPDAILLDIIMPIRDGIWASREIRNADALTGIPILLCSGCGSKESIEAAISSGANDYVAKPIHPGILKRKLARLLLGEKIQGIERRVAPRRTADITLIAEAQDAPGKVMLLAGRTLNISVGGLGFRHTPEPPVQEYQYEPHGVGPMHPLYPYALGNPEGMSLRIVIKLPDEGPPLQVLGRIAYAMAEGQTEICGVQFVVLADADLARIRTFVSREFTNLIQSDTFPPFPE